MSTQARIDSGPNATSSTAKMDMKLEVVAIPVANVDRAKAFYGGKLGWRLDADFTFGNFRGVQFTPPGSSCSVHFGVNVTPSPPGSAQNMFLVVPDVQAARDDLVRRGIMVSQVFHFDGAHSTVPGPAPGHESYGSYASFRDPDGNTWILQEVTSRRPGRVDTGVASFASTREIAAALRRAEAAHGEHEKLLGARDANWADWYAAYILAEQTGGQLPS